MELRKHLSFKKIFIGVYFLAFAIYLIIGLQPAEATHYEISAELAIPSINLTTDVTTLALEDYKLNTPDTIAGSYTRAENKTLLIGHSTTVFQNLDQVEVGDYVNYNDKTYQVDKIELMEKATIDMDEILATTQKDTIVIMTCAGTLLDGGDATHRLIITASSE